MLRGRESKTKLDNSSLIELVVPIKTELSGAYKNSFYAHTPGYSVYDLTR